MTDEESKRAHELLKNWQAFAQFIDAGPTEVAWAASTLAGHAIGQLSGMSPTAFVENVALVTKTVAAQAEETFSEPGPDIH